MRGWRPIAVIAILSLCAAPAFGGGGGENMLLVVNPNDPSSLQIANAYAALRDIPANNILYIAPPSDYHNDGQPISQAEVTSTYLTPISAAISARGLTGQINYIGTIGQAVSYSITPDSGLSATYANSLDYALSLLTPLTNGSGLTMQNAISHYDGSFLYMGTSGLYQNPSSIPINGVADAAIQHSSSYSETFYTSASNSSAFTVNTQYYMAGAIGYTGTNGNTVSQVIASLQSAAASDGTRPAGTIYFENSGDVNRSGPRIPEWAATESQLTARGIPWVQENSTTPLNRSSGSAAVLGAAIGASNLALPNGSTYLPGSWADNLTSYGAFFPDTGQTKATAFIAAGAAGTTGAVVEPYNIPQRFTNSSIYTFMADGATLGEAFAKSVATPDIQMPLGDMLAQPYADVPTATITAGPGNYGPAKGTISIAASAALSFSSTTAATAISKLELLVDGMVSSSGTLAGGSGTFSLSTTGLSDGVHEVRVVAINNAQAASEGYTVEPIVVNNHGRSINFNGGNLTLTSSAATIGLAAAAGDGTITQVELTCLGRVVAQGSGSPGSLSLSPTGLAPGDNVIVPVLIFSDSTQVAGGAFVVHVESGSPSGWTNSAATGLWSNPANWSGGASPQNNDGVARFSGSTSGGTVTLDSSASIEEIDFDNSGGGNYTLAASAGRTLTLSSSNGPMSQTLINVLSGNHTISAPLALSALGNLVTVTNSSDALTLGGSVSGPGALTKTGAGLLLLSGANSYSGVTTISGGTLQIGAGGASGSLGSGPVLNNSWLVFNRSGTLSVANVISGLGSVVQSGPGTVVLSGSDTYSGSTTVNGGLLSIAGSGSIGQSAILTINGGTLQLDDSTLNNNFGSSRLGNHPVALQGGTFAINLGNISGGTEALGSVAAVSGDNAFALTTGTGSGVISSGTLARTAGATLNFTGSLISSNRISFSSMPSGSNFIDAGTFVNGADYAVYDAGGYMRAMVTGSNSWDYATSLTNSRHVLLTTVASTSSSWTLLSLNLSGSNSGLSLSPSQTLTLTSGGILKGGGGTAAVAGGLGVSTTGEFVFRTDTAADLLAVNIPVIGGAGLTKSGLGTLVLGASGSSYGGATTIDAGTLRTSVAGAIPSSSPLLIASAAALDLGGQNQTVAGISLYDGAVQNSAAAAVLTLGGSAAGVSYAGVGYGSSISGGTLNLAANGSLSATHTFSVARGQGSVDLNILDNIADGAASQSLVKSGGGILQLSGANSYSGGTQILAGTLVLGSSAAIPATSNVTINAGTLNLGGYADTAASLTLQNGLITGSGSFSATSFNLQNGTLSGNLVGSGSLSKTTSGTVTITSSNSYNGGTSINAGTLLLGVANAIPAASPVTISGGTLNLGTLNVTVPSLTLQSGTVTSGTLTAPSYNLQSGFIAAALAGTGTLSKSTSGSVVLSGSNTYSGSTTISGGTLQVGSGGSGASIGGTSGVIDNGALIFNHSDNIVFSPAISGSGSLTNAGLGMLTLVGSSTYLGGTTISGGTLQVGNGGSGASIGSTSGVTNNASLIFNHSDAIVFSPAISGNGGVTNIGSGTLTLTGSNTYGGGTTVNGGLLQFGNASAIPANSALTVAGGTLDLGGLSMTTSAAVSFFGGVTQNGAITNNGAAGYIAQGGTVLASLNGSAGLNLSGSNTLTLSNSNTYSGNTTISGGTLNLAHPLAVQNSTLNLTSSGALAFAAGIIGPTLGGLSGNGNINLATSTSQAVTLNVGANGANTTYHGSLSGAGGLTKTGAGTLLLSASNTYSGATVVSGGTLQLSNGLVMHQLFANTPGLGAARNDGPYSLGHIFTVNPGNSVVVAQLGFFDADGNGLAIGHTVSLTDAINGNTVYATGTVSAGTGNSLSSTYRFVSLSSPVTLSAGTYELWATNIGGGNDGFNNGPVGTVDQGANGELTAYANQNGTYVAGGGGAFPTTSWQGGTDASLMYYDGVTGHLPTTTTLTLGASGGSPTFDLNGSSQQLAALSDNASFTNGVIANSNTGSTPVLTLSPTGGSNTFSGVIAGGGALGTISLTMSGSGTQILCGANSYTGTTTINGGTLQIGSGGISGALGSGPVVDNSSLVFNLASNYTLANNFSGNGSLLQSGSGALILTGSNSGNGTITIAGGTLQIGNGGYPGTGSIFDNSSLVLGRSDTWTLSSSVSGTGSLTQIGAGLVVLGGSNTYTGATTISGGTLQIGAGGTTGSLGSGPVIDNSAIYFNRADNYSVNNPISGTGSLTQFGPDTLILTGSNTYTGTTFIHGGALQVSLTSTLPSGSNVTLDGGVLETNGSLSRTIGSGAGQLQWTANGGGFSAYNGSLSVLLQTGTGSMLTWDSNIFGTLMFGSSTANSETDFNNAINLNGSDRTISVTAGTGGDRAVMGNVISGTGGLIKTGNGLLVLAQNNLYTGTTTITGGTLQVGNGRTTGTVSSGAVVDNAVLAFSRTDTSPYFFNNNISGSGGLIQNGNGYLSLAGSNTYSGTTTISKGTLQIGNGGTAGTIGSGPVVDNAALIFNRSNGLNVSNAISGSGAVTVLGGNFVFTGSNTYTGATTVSASTLQIGSGGTAGSLGSGPVIDNAALVLDRSDAINLVGAISGSGAVFQIGPGMLTLAASNTYSGGTTISAGTLAVSSSANLGSGGLTFSGSAASVLDFTGSSAITSSLPITLNQNGTIQQDDSAQVKLTGSISGSGALIKSDSGLLVLSGTNSYSGGTVVTGGTLEFLNSWSMPGGSLTVGNPAPFLSPDVPELSSIALSPAVSLASGLGNGDITIPSAPSTNSADPSSNLSIASQPGLNVVPRPGTLLILLAAGGCGLSWHVRRRKSRTKSP